MTADLRSWFEQEAWARAWSRRAALVDPLVPVLVNALDPQPGERILDVGTGVAPAAIAAAPRVQPTGAVTAVDISGPVLEIARKRADAAGVDVALHQLDAARDSVPGAPFDAAMSMLGVMFFPDPVAAFRNIATQIRPGARVAFVCWAEPEANPLLAETLLAPFLPPDGQSDASDGGSFSLARPEAVERILSSAGLEGIDVRRVVRSVPVTPADVFERDLLDLYGVPEDRRPEALSHVARELAGYTGAAGLRAPLAINLVRARVPA